MRITLIQAEIDLAIMNYINSQVNVKEGMTISVDLSATRGENGFTATIDIISAKVPKLEPVKKDISESKPEAPSEVEKAVPPVKEEPKPLNLVQPVTEATKQEPEQPVVIAPAVERPRSLFQGLQKPINPSN